MALDIAFYTLGDTRSPDALPLARRRSTLPAARLPYATVSEAYREYSRLLVGPRGGVFGESSSDRARGALAAWLAAEPERRVRHVYFVGHGNRFFAWRVQIQSSAVAGLEFLGSSVETFHGPQPRINPSSAHQRFFDVVSRAMDSEDNLHHVELRCCYLVQSTVDHIAVMVGHPSHRRGLRIEVRGYRDYYALIPSSERRFRSQLETRDRRVVGEASGTRAPRPQLFACVEGELAIAGERCR